MSFASRSAVRWWVALASFSPLISPPPGAARSEVIGQAQLVLAGQTHDLVEKAPGDVGLHQALSQTTETGLIQSTRIQVQIEAPAKEPVVIERLSEPSTRALQVTGNHQLDLEQALRRNRRTARRGIKAAQVRGSAGSASFFTCPSGCSSGIRDSTDK